MGQMREMFPQFFTKKAKEERAKAPKEPICPKMPSEPQPPNKYLYINRQSLTITDDSGNGSDVIIPFSKIMELRSQINVKDECINIKITSSSSYCGGGSFDKTVSNRRMEAVARIDQTVFEIADRHYRACR